MGGSSRYITLSIILLSSALLLNHVHAQDTHATFYKESLQINNIGMMVLGTWAVTNLSTGAYGWSKNSGSRMYFHQMNLFWNSVNLALAGLALYGNYASEFISWPPEEILGKQLKTQRIFLINAGVDVAYMGTGLLLRNIARRHPKNESRLTGYGNSIMVQGAFLFVFDLVMFGLQRGHRNGFLEQITLTSMTDGVGLMLTLNL